ncbi:MAG: hypothetical protein ABSA76_07875 [Bacteroidales bacterium]
MKKVIFSSLVIALIIGGCARNKPVEKTVLGMWTDYYLIPNTLKGKIKELKELNFWAIEKDGKITKGELMTIKDLDSVGSTKNLIAYFDDKGNITRCDRLDKENVIQSYIGTIENGKCTRWDIKVKDSITSYVIPLYDDQGYLTGAKAYTPLVDTLIEKYVFTHDSKGNFTKFEYFDYKNQRTGYNINLLNDKGNIIESRYFDKADSLRSTMTNMYDDNGNMTKQVTYSERRKTTVIWDYKDLKSDDHGNVIEYYANVDNGKYKIFVERTFIYY